MIAECGHTPAPSISLAPVTQGNPFADHPQLRTIWPAEFGIIAEEAAQEAVACRPAHDIGGLYLVRLGAEVVGITGYFYVDDVAEPFLRWHGIVPAARGQGISGQALALVIASIRANLPDAQGLTELVPSSADGAAIARHFARLGFRPHGAAERYDWSPYTWQPVRLAFAGA